MNYPDPMTDERPPAPTITAVAYDAATAPSAVHVTGTSEVAGTVTLYDGDDPISTTSTVDEGDTLTFSFTITDPFIGAGTHSYSACVTTGAANPEDGTVVTSEWSVVVAVTIP